MTRRRWLATGLALATTLATSGCLCGADEERAVTVGSADSLTVVRDGGTTRVEVALRLTDPPLPPSTFDFVYNTLEGDTSGDGIALTLSGAGSTPNELVMLVLALPTSLRRGEEYTVGATFSVEPGASGDPRLSGEYNLQRPDRAEAAFAIATYTFPPPQYVTSFRATSSTGTVRVTGRERGRVELSLNLRFVDAAGRATTVTGRAYAVTERYTPPCT